jgi:hypothetical protein
LSKKIKDKRPKWPKKDCFHVGIEPYGGSLFVFKDPKALDTAYASLGCERSSDLVAGSCAYMENDKTGEAIFLMLIADGKIGTYVHEADHLKAFILKRVGFNFEDGNTEPMCYFANWLWDKVSVGYKKKFKKALK